MTTQEAGPFGAREAMGSLIHLIRTREPRRGEIVSRPEGNTYPDLATFLERVMAWPTATGH